ncbi:MAG: T9SS type A sorting domain-containing protein, partial [Chlorobi bacterium]|nr:T9SS type A sorting domain-containing protein [Chlorobiota bacterium]
DIGQAIIQTSDGGFLVGGSSAIGNGGNIICTPHSWAAEAILVKLDAELNIEWQHCYGGSDHDGATALEEVSDGYIFGGYASSNDGDIWIVKVDFFGSIIWQECLGGSNSEFIYKLIVTENEDIIVPGYTRSTDGDVTGNHTISEYEADIWVVKLNSSGDLIWEQCFGGIWDEQVNFGFLQKADNNFVIAGQTDYGPSFDVACTPHGGYYDRDFWVFEVKGVTTNVDVGEFHKPGLKVYPNPARDYVVFELNEYPQNVTIHIVNVFGEQVETLLIKAEKTVWDTREVQSGIYFYHVEIDGKVFSGKIVVQK